MVAVAVAVYTGSSSWVGGDVGDVGKCWRYLMCAESARSMYVAEYIKEGWE